MSSHLARLEALLFVAGEDGLSLRTMAQLLEIPVTGFHLPSFPAFLILLDRVSSF